MPRVRMLLVSALLLTPWPAMAQAGVQGAEGLTQGRQALEARRFREAAATLERTVAVAPTVEGFWLLGRAYWGEDRPYPISADRAIRAFGRAVELDPTLSSVPALAALEQLAFAAVRHERLAEARSAFVRLAARHTDPQRRARFLTQIDEIDLDQGVYRPPLKTNFNSRGDVLGPVGPLQMRTNQHFEKGRHTSDPVTAEAHFRRAIVTDPTMHQAYLNLAQAIVHQHRCAEALPYLEEADRVWRINHPDEPPYERAHVSFVRCYLELGDVEKAIAHQRILDAIPGQDNWEVLYALRIRIAAGSAADVIPVLEDGALADPDNVDVLHALATAYAATGRYADAARQMQDALDAIPAGQPVLTPLIEPWNARRIEWLAKVK